MDCKTYQFLKIHTYKDWYFVMLLVFSRSRSLAKYESSIINELSILMSVGNTHLFLDATFKNLPNAGGVLSLSRNVLGARNSLVFFVR